MARRPRSIQAACCLVALAATGGLLTRPVQSASYIFASVPNGVGLITHPIGYAGTGGALALTVGIDPTSANAASMAISVQNIVGAFNALIATSGNLVVPSPDLTSSEVDFESVALHELGHSLGLAHPNAATESNLGEPDRNYTRATDGVDDMPDVNTPADFNLGIGADGVRGSSDDIRGNDVNLHWFRISNNNPFTIAGIVDSTTYSRTATLPTGHTFAANADRTVGALLGVPNTEAVQQQGTFSDETQRTLGHDDVAGLKLAMSGLDEIAGNGDDYTVSLSYAGLTASADIVIDFDNSETGFAASKINGVFLSATHAAVTSTAIFFNTGFFWFFNDTLNGCTFSINPTAVNTPAAGASASVAVTAGAGCAWTAVSNDAFVMVTGGASGTGNGTVNYTVASNATTTARTGTVTIAGQTFTVTQQGLFTDDPLAVGTPVKAVHITELRTRINALRAACLAVPEAFMFANPTLTPGTTPVRAVHLTEMRTALSEAYVACGQMAPSYAATITAGATVIAAAHSSELRTLVIALEAIAP